VADHLIDSDRDTPVYLYGKNSHWILPAGLTVSVTNSPASIVNAADTGVLLTVDGMVRNTDPDGTGIVMNGKTNGVDVPKQGAVEADTGLSFHAAHFSLVNRGSIDGQTAGISGMGNDFDLVNRGEIHADAGWAIHLRAEFGTVTIGKTGLLSGGGGIDVDGGTAGVYSADVTNLGTIQSSGIAVDLGKGDNHFVNRGQIVGDVFAGGGGDWIDLAGGTIEGKVHGGKGDDFYVIDSDQPTIVEKAGGGYDVVYTTVSFAIGIGQELENLFAEGDGDIDLTGNAADNQLLGNAGANTLLGGGGKDYMTGYAGDDMLTGGADADTFVFGPGHGADIIEDFDASGDDHDILSLYRIKHVEHFEDIVSRLSDTDEGVLMKLGKHDSVLIKGVTTSELTADHFDI
jgi:Ca2+-binding RTX toxin-like protein